MGLILLELSIVATGLLFIFAYTSDINNTLLSDVCGPMMKMDGASSNLVDKAFSLLNTKDGELDFKIIISTLII